MSSFLAIIKSTLLLNDQVWELRAGLVLITQEKINILLFLYLSDSNTFIDFYFSAFKLIQNVKS